MLENAIKLCTQSLWNTDKKFWYISFHCRFWLDYYLTLDPTTFKPPPPFTLSEFNADGEMPNRIYTKEELLLYLNFNRDNCSNLIDKLTDELAASLWINETKDYSVLEILLYNMRHVQHHTAQLNLILRQEIDDAPKWVSVAD